MKRKINIGNLVICLLLLTGVKATAQVINSNEYTYHINNIEYRITQCSIHNNTNEKMLVWLEKDSVVQRKNFRDKVKKYFFSIKGDFSLVNVINEYGSTLNGFETEIFNTFYKIIEPDGIFWIQIIDKSHNKNCYESLSKMILSVTSSQIEKES